MKFLPVTLTTVLLGLSLLLITVTGTVTWGQGQTDDHTPSKSLVTLSTGFNYQGALSSGGSPVNDTCDIQAGLWGAVNQGTQIGNTQTITSVSVANGQFTVQLNAGNEFGSSAFNGDARWLQMAVRCPAGSGNYTTLSPRQTITAVPYALYALNAPESEEHSHFGEFWSGSASRGLEVVNSDASDWSAGVRGESTAVRGRGVVGYASSATGTTAGVEGETESSEGLGVLGYALATSGENIGVLGITQSISGTGVAGEAKSTSGVNYGVVGVSRSPDGFAGFFDGRVKANNTIESASGGFKFPDGSVQTTAAAALSCTSVVQNYSSTVDVNCPSGYTAVTASCNVGLSVVLHGQEQPPISGSWVWYLIPNADAATGVHCELTGGAIVSQVHLRCCQ